MSLISFILGNSKFPAKLISSAVAIDTGIEEIVFDVSETINHEMTSTPTQNPVEDGAFVSDHVIRNNRKLTIKGIIAEYPMQAIGTLGILGVTSLGRSQAAYEALKALWMSRIPFQVEAGRDSYDPVIITSLTFEESKTTGDILPFTITFEEIQLSSVQIVKIPENILSVEASGASSLVDKGKQLTNNLSESASSAINEKSWLRATAPVLKEILGE